jgi:hypothetical protein
MSGRYSYDMPTNGYLGKGSKQPVARMTRRKEW